MLCSQSSFFVAFPHDHAYLLHAGYFVFKPHECSSCHSHGTITDTIVKTQALDYITLGKDTTGIAVA